LQLQQKPTSATDKFLSNFCVQKTCFFDIEKKDNFSDLAQKKTACQINDKRFGNGSEIGYPFHF
jgi:hypothetical protein